MMQLLLLLFLLELRGVETTLSVNPPHVSITRLLPRYLWPVISLELILGHLLRMNRRRLKCQKSRWRLEQRNILMLIAILHWEILLRALNSDMLELQLAQILTHQL